MHIEWFDSPPDSVHASAKESIETIWAYDRELGERVSQFSWVGDEVIEREQLLLEEIAALTAGHPDLAKSLASFLWMEASGGVTTAASRGVASIRLTADIDFELGEKLLDYSWLQNGFSSMEAEALENIASLAATDSDTASLLASSEGFEDESALEHVARAAAAIHGILQENQSLGMKIAKFPWVVDGITRIEARALVGIHNLVRSESWNNPRLDEVLLGYDWMVDGVSASEAKALDGFLLLLRASERQNSGLAEELARHDWVANGVTSEDLEAVRWFEQLLDIAGPDNADVVGTLVASAWVADGVTAAEQDDLNIYWRLFESARGQDAKYQEKLTLYSWVSDGITDEEWDAIAPIYDSVEATGRENSHLSEKLLDYPWIADGINKSEQDSLYIFASLFETVRNVDSDIADQILSYAWISDGMTTPEPDVINRFRDLIVSARAANFDGAATVVGYRWVVDGITPRENDVLYTLLRIFETADLRSAGEVEELLASPWVSDGISTSELEQVQRFQELLGPDTVDTPLISDELKGLPWVSDGIAGQELAALNGLQALLVAADQAGAVSGSLLLEYNWIRNGISRGELEALYIISLWLESSGPESSSFADAVVAFPWVADSLTEIEVDGINSLRLLQTSAIESHSVLADMLAVWPWIKGGLTDPEIGALHRLGELLKASRATGPESREKLAGHAWVEDWISEVENDTLYVFQTLIESAGTANSSFVAKVANYPWVADGIAIDETQNEADAINRLRDVLRFTAPFDPELAERWADYSWVADGLTTLEMGALGEFWDLLARAAESDSDVAGHFDYPWISKCATIYLPKKQAGIQEFLQSSNPEFGILLRQLLTAPWLEDGIVAGETETVGLVRDLIGSFGETNEFIAEKLAQYPWPPGGATQFECHALNRLRSLLTDPETGLSEVPWVDDGIDSEELALISVLDETRGRSKDQYQDLLESHYVRSKTITLPLAGEIRFRVFRHSPFPGNDDSIELMEDIARHLEEFMRVPFPWDPVVIGIIEPSLRAGEKPERGVGYSVIDQLAITGREYNRDFDLAVFHEMSHIYWGGHTGAPPWFTEGAAGFLPDYARAELGRQRISSRRLNLHQVWEDECRVWGAGTISRFLRMRDVDPDRFESRGICTYALGEFFLLETYQLFGKDAASAAMRQLYLEAEATGWAEPITEEQIYRVYRANAPRGKEEAFEAVYERYHGGSYH